MQSKIMMDWAMQCACMYTAEQVGLPDWNLNSQNKRTI